MEPLFSHNHSKKMKTMLVNVNESNALLLFMAASNLETFFLVFKKTFKSESDLHSKTLIVMTVW
jgi:hypothetical protein